VWLNEIAFEVEFGLSSNFFAKVVHKNLGIAIFVFGKL